MVLIKKQKYLNGFIGPRWSLVRSVINMDPKVVKIDVIRNLGLMYRFEKGSISWPVIEESCIFVIPNKPIKRYLSFASPFPKMLVSKT